MHSNDTQTIAGRRASALENPSRVYRTPDDVLRDPTLDDATRRRILEGWALDERRLMVSTEENMAGGPAHRLGAVMVALRRLDAERDSAGDPTG